MRYRLEALRLIELFERAEAHNFADTVKVVPGRMLLSEANLEEHELVEMIEIALGIGAAPLLVLIDFTGGDMKALQFHDRFSGANRDPDEMSIQGIDARLKQLLDDKTGLEVFITRMELTKAGVFGTSRSLLPAYQHKKKRVAFSMLCTPPS